jgi:hypothetical protein
MKDSRIFFSKDLKSKRKNDHRVSAEKVYSWKVDATGEFLLKGTGGRREEEDGLVGVEGVGLRRPRAAHRERAERSGMMGSDAGRAVVQDDTPHSFCAYA